MDKKQGIMAWAMKGAKHELQCVQTKRRKIESILRDQVIISRLSSNTLEELDGLANKYGVAEEVTQRFLDHGSNGEPLAK